MQIALLTAQPYPSPPWKRKMAEQSLLPRPISRLTALSTGLASFASLTTLCVTREQLTQNVSKHLVGDMQVRITQRATASCKHGRIILNPSHTTSPKGFADLKHCQIKRAPIWHMKLPGYCTQVIPTRIYPR